MDEPARNSVHGSAPSIPASSGDNVIIDLMPEEAHMGPRCSRKIIRYTAKRRGCAECNGPCDGDYSPIGESIADRFMAIAARMKKPGPAATTAAIHRPAPQAPKKKLRARDHAVIPHFGRPPKWLIDNPFIGKGRIHESHMVHIKWHRGLTWCGQCGTYATVVPLNLKSLCPGAAGTIDSNRCLNRLNKGLLPPKLDCWPEDEDAGV